MESQAEKQQTLTEFMTPGKALRVWQIIFAVLLTVMIIGAGYEFSKPQAEPVQMRYDLPSGTYAYLDIQLLSDWVLDITGEDDYTFYEAVDPDGNWFILSINQSQFSSFAPYYDAYNAYFAEDANYVYPEPIRVTGLTKSIASDEFDELADYYGATSSEVENYFGSYYLDEGASNQYAGAVLYLVGAFLFGLFFLVVTLQAGGMRKNYQKSDIRLYELGKADDAEVEFSAPDSKHFPKAKLILSRQFVYCGSSGWVLPYEDIGWAYQRTQRSYGIAVGKQIIAGLANGKTIVLAARGVNDAVLTETARAIYEANPNCLIGYTADNIKLYRQRVKEYKLSHSK